MKTSRVVFNITLSVNWRRRAVGLVRVERELLKGLATLIPERICAVYYEVNSDSWRTIPHSILNKVLDDSWVLSEGYDDEKNKISLVGLHEFRPKNDDRFISLGSDWSYGVPRLVKRIYGDHRVMIPACYDLIPLIFPEFTPGPEFFDQFNVHYTDVVDVARSVFAISENSKKDLVNFWEKNGLSNRAPPIEVVPLAGLNSNGALPALSTADAELMNNIRGIGDYVIFVSTFEPRKNHQLLMDLWRQLYSVRGKKCPHLLVVGMRGWGSTDLIDQMSRMTATKEGKISWHQGISDELLCHLYSNSLFSVFPSFYEGWGLAATEALNYGKVCIIANNSALDEATYGLMPSYHPLDFPGWFSEINRLLDDVPYRKSIERRLLSNTSARGWIDFAKEFSEKLL